MPEAQGENNSNNTMAIGAVVATGFIMVAITIWVIYMAFRHEGVGNFASIATLILVGLAAFIGIMNMLSLTAHWMNIVDLKQPFGLPEGTVRAILTIAFIVLVGVLTSFMLSNGQRPPFSKDPLIVATGIPHAAALVLEQKFSAEGIVAVFKDEPAKQAKKAPPPTKESANPAAQDPANPAAKDQPNVGAKDQANPTARDAQETATDTYTVKFFPRVDYRQSDEIAKQILTILSTILAAMIGFYFGAKPGESAAQRTDATQQQKPDDKATLIAEYNTLKAKPPTLKDVTEKLAKADEAKKNLLQPRLDEIKKKLEAAEKALSDPAATIETVRTNVATAKAEHTKLEDLDKEIDKKT
jgi:hypothetical protein